MMRFTLRGERLDEDNCRSIGSVEMSFEAEALDEILPNIEAFLQGCSFKLPSPLGFDEEPEEIDYTGDAMPEKSYTERRK